MLDLDPRDYDSRDDERHSYTPSHGGRGTSGDHERDHDWRQPDTRTRDRQARVERLRMLVIMIAVALKEAASVLRQAHRMVAVPGHARGLDQPLFAQVSQVATPWISRAPIMVSEITAEDHPERTNGRERPGFGAARCIRDRGRFGVRLNTKAETVRDRRISREEEKRLLDAAVAMNT